MKVCQFWARGFMSLSHKYEERVQKFSFLVRHCFKAELYCYIYTVMFRKQLSELYWIVPLCSIFIRSSIKSNAMTFFNISYCFLPEIFHTISHEIFFCFSQKHSNSMVVKSIPSLFN